MAINGKQLLIASLSFVFLLLYPGLSQAKELGGQGVEVSPAFIDVELTHPGDVKQVPFTFTNYTNKQITLDLSPIDFKQRDDMGDIGFVGRDTGSYSYSLSSFLSFEANRITLEPQENRVFLVTITNRDDMSPGGHYAAVVAKLVSDTPGIATTIQPSVSSLIMLRKTGGERFNLSLTDITLPGDISFTTPRTLQLVFQNEGNIHVIPYGLVEIKDVFGRLVSKGIINTSSYRVLPQSRRIISVDMVPQAYSWPISLNTITVRGHDSLDKVTFLQKEIYVSCNPVV